MQKVLHQDVSALARCLMLVPSSGRESYAARCVEIASIADRWRRDTGKAHPLFGDGTLLSACLGLPKARESTPDDVAYGACLICAISVVLEKRLASCAGNTKR